VTALAEGSKIIQKVDPLSGSTQPNESFHTVKGKYADKRLNFMTSFKARFALGVILSPDRGTRAGKTSYANPWTFSHSRQNVSRCSGTWKQDANEKMGKGEKNPKAERKTKPEMSREQEPVGAARERTTTTSGNSMNSLQTKPMKKNFTAHKKTRYDPTIITGFPSANIHVCYSHF
jgi:hypothetical protein